MACIFKLKATVAAPTDGGVHEECGGNKAQLYVHKLGQREKEDIDEKVLRKDACDTSPDVRRRDSDRRTNRQTDNGHVQEATDSEKNRHP